MGNVEFTTEACPTPVARTDNAFDMVSLYPEENLAQDGTRDLERQLRAVNEVLQLLLCDVDVFPNLMDIDQVSEGNLNAMLAHLGSPFSFSNSLSEVERRRLASVLVDMYKRKGGEIGMESVVSFVLGFTIDIQPFLDTGDTWLLGEGLLGEDTILGPGTVFLLYSFQVDSAIDLTETQRRRLIEIVQYMKPAHTHFVRLIEPTNADTLVDPLLVPSATPQP